MKDCPILHTHPKGITVKDVIDHYEILISHDKPGTLIAGIGITAFSALILFLLVNFGDIGGTCSTNGRQHECRVIDYAFFILIAIAVAVLGIFVIFLGLNALLSKTKISIYEDGRFTIQRINKFGNPTPLLECEPNEKTKLSRLPASEANGVPLKWKLRIQSSYGQYECDGMSEEKWKWIEKIILSLSPSVQRKQLSTAEAQMEDFKAFQNAFMGPDVTIRPDDNSDGTNKY